MEYFAVTPSTCRFAKYEHGETESACIPISVCARDGWARLSYQRVRAPAPAHVNGRTGAGTLNLLSKDKTLAEYSAHLPGAPRVGGVTKGGRGRGGLAWGEGGGAEGKSRV